MKSGLVLDFSQDLFKGSPWVACAIPLNDHTFFGVLSSIWWMPNEKKAGTIVTNLCQNDTNM
jgi:hypothetical protein